MHRGLVDSVSVIPRALLLAIGSWALGARHTVAVVARRWSLRVVVERRSRAGARASDDDSGDFQGVRYCSRLKEQLLPENVRAARWPLPRPHPSGTVSGGSPRRGSPKEVGAGPCRVGTGTVAHVIDRCGLGLCALQCCARDARWAWLASSVHE